MDRVVLIRRRRPGYVGPLHGMQLVVVELTLFGGLAALAYGALAATGVAVVAGAVLVLSLARWRGRWLLERRLMVRRYRARRRLARAAGPPTSALGLLRTLSPDLRVVDVAVAGGRQVGVGQDDAGWFAAATVAPGVLARRRTDGPAHPGLFPPEVPLDLLAASIADADQAGAVVQLVVRAVPSSSSTPVSPAERSYRDLLAQAGIPAVPADRAVSVVVRLDARLLAEALGDHNADIRSAPYVVASLLRRLVTTLRQADIDASMMDAAGLVAHLADSCDPHPAAGPAAEVARERWSAWRGSELAHRSFWISDWPPADRAPALFDAVFAVPTTMTTLSIVLDPDPRTGLVDLTGLVRVTAPAGQLAQAGRSVVRAARMARADLFPLDGEQAPAAYASAPTGGGAR